MKLKILILLLIVIPASRSEAAKWYVNTNIGDDILYDGTAPSISASVGPKKTINSAILLASSNDTIYISEGIYDEKIVINIPLVIRGNNWGINPLIQTRNPETIIVPPNLSIGTAISGNSAIEIASCCIEIDGIKIHGDNDIVSTSSTKYGKEFEISYGIAGSGAYSNLRFTNLIIKNFAIAGIYMSSGVFSTKSNKIDNCEIKTGDQNSEAIILTDNFYCDIIFVTIDSTAKGISLNNFSDKNSKTFYFSYLNISSETNGMMLNNFSGNTDSLIFEYNIYSSFSPLIDFTGFGISDISSKGYIRFSDNTIISATKGFGIRNLFDKFKIDFLNNIFNNGSVGMYIEQSIITPSIDLTLKNIEFKSLDSAAIITSVDGDLITLDLIDLKISQSTNGIILNGNATINPNNAKFDLINRFYLYLDSSALGLRPINNIDATTISYDAVLGNALTNSQAFKVEDKIHHFLDQKTMGWVLFKDKNLYVSNRDGNNELQRAVKVASDDWNIYLDSISSSENVTIDKNIHLYPHKAAGIGKIIMSSKNRTLYLHGKLYLQEGLGLIQGIIETTPSDTLIVYRSNINTVLNPGNSLSFVRGPLYIRYINIPENYVIKDTIPLGLGDDYRPMYINSTWPAGLVFFDMGFKSFTGRAPIVTLPSGISHISDIRYWQITNPFNKTGFIFTSIGFLYDSLLINDLVNDPANLRVVSRDGSGASDLGGSGTLAKNGSIMSTTGTPGFGYYTAGNANGGNNLLSADQPVALISTTGHCGKDSILFSAANSKSDSPITSYEWLIQGPSVVLSPENNDTIKKKIDIGGDYTIRLIVTNTFGYMDTIINTLKIDSVPFVAYTIQKPCFPLPLEFKNNSILPPNTSITATEWKINTSIFTTPDLNYTPTLAGLQSGYLMVTLSNGCSDTAHISEISPVTPQITLNPHGIIEICSGDSAVIHITKSLGTLIWNDGQTYDSLILKTNTFKKATIFSSAQCFRTDSVISKVLDRPTVDAGPDFTTLPGKQVILKGSSNAMVEWIPDTWLNDATIQNPSSRPLVSTQYILRAYNTIGCENTDTMEVIVNSENTTNVPNLLTPNGDGHNDVWVLSNIPDPQNCSVHVFTREGQLVFSSASYNNGWDGKRDTNVLPDGYYAFVIENKSAGKVYTGILNILK